MGKENTKGRTSTVKSLDRKIIIRTEKEKKRVRKQSKNRGFKENEKQELEKDDKLKTIPIARLHYLKNEFNHGQIRPSETP